MRLISRLVVFGLVDLTLLLVLANYTSWEMALVEVLASGLLGVAVIRYVTAHFGHRVLSRLAASESPGPVLADGAILFVAGILLILPGIVSDIVGLLLLIPLVRRQTVAWLRRRLIRHAERFTPGLSTRSWPTIRGRRGPLSIATSRTTSHKKSLEGTFLVRRSSQPLHRWAVFDGPSGTENCSVTLCNDDVFPPPPSP